MGIGILVMAFPEVNPMLSANLSEERIFNGVFEQRLFIKQISLLVMAISVENSELCIDLS